jgi:hypothetical protein
LAVLRTKSGRTTPRRGGAAADAGDGACDNDVGPEGNLPPQTPRGVTTALPAESSATVF